MLMVVGERQDDHDVALMVHLDWEGKEGEESKGGKIWHNPANST